jgi:hypothetical protein
LSKLMFVDQILARYAEPKSQIIDLTVSRKSLPSEAMFAEE